MSKSKREKPAPPTPSVKLIAADYMASHYPKVDEWTATVKDGQISIVYRMPTAIRTIKIRFSLDLDTVTQENSAS